MKLWKLRFRNWIRQINRWRFNPTKLIGGILFIIAWIHGDIGGLLAWAILLLFLDTELTWTRR